MKIIRSVFLIAGMTLAGSSVALAEEPMYSELVCSDLLAMDSAAQEKAIDWLNGYVAENNTMRLEQLVDLPYSKTVEGCKAKPDAKVKDIINLEH